MIRRRLAALLAALLLLPGEAARAAVWCGAANKPATTLAKASPTAPTASETDVAPVPMDHATHHAAIVVDAPAPASAPQDHAPWSSHHGGSRECPLMAACASAAVALRVSLTDAPMVSALEATHARSPQLLATVDIAPEPPPPR